MLGTIGDLVEDVVVHVAEPIHIASDTAAHVERRRGGSAANMAVSVVHAGGSARFIGQVGEDAVGTWLVEELRAAGVDACVRHGGRTGTIIVVVDRTGERSFLTDRAACALLADPDPRWLDDLATLHVPAYSLFGDPLATTAATLVGWARDRGVRVSIDASSSALIEGHGAASVGALLASLAPDVLLCNELEAAALGGPDQLDRIGVPLTIVKQGPGDAIVRLDGGRRVLAVPAVRVDDVRDTTGAGDAFAAGLLLALASGAEVEPAVVAGHACAADLLAERSAGVRAG